MIETTQPVKCQAAGISDLGRQGDGTLLLYGDRLAHVTSGARQWGSIAGFFVVLALGLAFTGRGPGALGAHLTVGATGLLIIGIAVAAVLLSGRDIRRQANGLPTGRDAQVGERFRT